VGVVDDLEYTRGPARLAKTLALGRDQNGIDTASAGSAFVVRAPTRDPSTASLGAVVRTGPRVGVSRRGGDAAASPWRFWLEGEATVSAYRPGVVRRPKPAAPKPGARATDRKWPAAP
jgi:DNA-3-methyladenine glycosylase